MTFLRTLRKLVFGETWILPLGVAVAIGVALIARQALGGHWHTLGGFVLLAGAATALVVSVNRSA